MGALGPGGVLSSGVSRRGAPERPGRRRAGLAAGALLILLVVVLAMQGSGPLRAPVARDATAPSAGDPFAFRPGREAEYVQRAVAGEAHVLFAQSPDGVLNTAARVAALRPLIDAVGAGSGLSADWLEGLVFVESAGRPGAMANGSPSGASGLTQILPTTATGMLGLHVDLTQSTRLTQAIARAQASGAPPAAIQALVQQRAAVDERFAPRQALAATVRYLELARQRLGRADLAFVSYHMGQGNLEQVLDAYDGGSAVPYARLYFDTAPDHHPAAYRLLAGLSDQSSLYFWRVLGAAAVMHLYRSDRAALVRLAELQTAQDSAAEVLHPPDRTPVYADPRALERGYGDGSLQALPGNGDQLGLAYAGSIGALSSHLHAPTGLYRGLRPAALALLLELAARVRALSQATPLTVTSAVSDQSYQRLLGLSDPPAAAGWSFTLARRYVSGAQAGALQAMLDRLQALNLIAWTAYPSELEVTVAADAGQVIAHGP